MQARPLADGEDDLWLAVRGEDEKGRARLGRRAERDARCFLLALGDREPVARLRGQFLKLVAADRHEPGLDELRRLQPEADFDERRFRMNLIVDSNADGFIENDWIEREVMIGKSVRIVVTMPDPRCVMTTLAQDELPRDNEVLRTLVKHNRLPIGDSGAFPCAGVYAVVTAPGSVRVGDEVIVSGA